MAGGFSGKFDPKLQQLIKANNNEVLKDSTNFPAPKKSLFGILSLNQPSEITPNHQEKTQENPWTISHLEKETKVLFDQHQVEIKKEIEEILAAIKQLIEKSQDLKEEVKQTVFPEVVEPSNYQVGFLGRIKKYILDSIQDISEANLWVNSFNTRKKKRNYYWNTGKSKKGGQQYLNSSEHSISRSVN
ncbi:MAG TPA: DUF5660 domain-containing protein [Candidatus Woesebacteria bacterium]|nr:DUF5660 domain-containing protein [Candidatus Woesebacteria bacterium]HPJ17116.1 DUF5660 domain-containing protein [Candidatus Woesebacteria bacterium]